MLTYKDHEEHDHDRSFKRVCAPLQTKSCTAEVQCKGETRVNKEGEIRKETRGDEEGDQKKQERRAMQEGALTSHCRTLKLFRTAVGSELHVH